MIRRHFLTWLGSLATALPFVGGKSLAQAIPPLMPVRQRWMDQYDEAILSCEFTRNVILDERYRAKVVTVGRTCIRNLPIYPIGRFADAMRCDILSDAYLSIPGYRAKELHIETDVFGKSIRWRAVHEEIEA